MKGIALLALVILGPIGHGVVSHIPLPEHTAWSSHDTPHHSFPHRAKFEIPAENPDDITTISHVLRHPEKYHQQVIRLHGTVTRLELHLDDTHHFIDFVFFLKDGKQRILVFGRHDRTSGDIQLTSDRIVEVQGIFWQERFANGHRFENNVEAQHIHFHPPLLPDQAKGSQRKQKAKALI